jgi:hypothetical protein
MHACCILVGPQFASLILDRVANCTPGSNRLKCLLVGKTN